MADAARHVDPDAAAQLCAWLTQQGLEGAGQAALLEELCVRLVAAGLPLYRTHVAQSAFHPNYGGIGFSWRRVGGMEQERYAPTDTPVDAWINSPLYHILASGTPEFRERLDASAGPSRYPLLNELCEEGCTDYFACALILEKPDPKQVVDPKSPPEGVLISWASDGPEGFSEADLNLIRTILPHLALALKSAANKRIGEELLAVYLGRDAGARVMSGALGRGSLQTIDAVILYFDLTGFTRLAEQTDGETLIAMLNDYYGEVVAEIQGNGGNILKFMGDGLLAMFRLDGRQAAAAAALETAVALRRRIAGKNTRRLADGLPVTGFTLALHAGEILYGNIGAENRLDFTAIGPAVNLTARLSGMHKAVGQDLILSQEIRDAAPETRHDIVSLGRYMLRGVSEPQTLYTIFLPGG